MQEEQLNKLTKQQLVALCMNLAYERDCNIKEKEIVLTAFNNCLNELKEIRKSFVVLTSKDVEDYIKQIKESME